MAYRAADRDSTQVLRTGGEVTMSTVMSTETLWVVIDGTGRIVLVCGGADGASVAADWAKRGFGVRSLAASEVVVT